MKESKIQPERITKPIQLLGAWLVGLFSVNSSFLFTAANMPIDSWETKALIIAAILNVPIFLVAVFVLQTRFRPELQEDAYYSSYLSQKTNEIVTVNKTTTQLNEIEATLRQLEEKSNSPVNSVVVSRTPLYKLLVGVHKKFEIDDAVEKSLEEFGVESYVRFGGDKLPDKIVMAIDLHLSGNEVENAIELAKTLQLDGYSFFNRFEEGSDESILIGSYGKLEYEIVRKSA